MAAAVKPVDHDIPLIIQLVAQALCGDPSNHGSPCAGCVEDGQLARLFAKRALHGADDVAPLSQGPQDRFGIAPDQPFSRPVFPGETERSQAVEAAHEPHPLPQLGRRLQCCSEINCTVSGSRLQFAVERGPAVLFYLALQASLDLEVGAWTKPFGGELARTPAHAIGDVIA